MRQFIIILFFVVLFADVVVVLDATSHPIMGVEISDQKVDGVLVVRQATSEESYSYFMLVNKNDYPVSVQYEIENTPMGKMVLQKGESKRLPTAYADDKHITLIVSKLEPNIISKKGLIGQN